MSHNYALSPYEISLICHSLESRMESANKLIEIFKNYNDEKAPKLFKLYSEEKAAIESLRARLAMELSDNL